MSIEALKEKARRHEQEEDWQKALDYYLQAVRRFDEDEEDYDISLFNRIGDLEVRVGRVDRAVEHYERAVDLYVEQGLPNNAIAICKKVMRNLPERHSIYLKMGQIRAHQGFRTDARENFLAYAEQKQAEGDLEEAFRALIEFVELVPDDIEIRMALASQLAEHERVDEAVEQYREARRHLVLDDRDDEAREVAESILELDPGADVEAPADIRAAGAEALRSSTASEEEDWIGGLSDFPLDGGEGAAAEAGAGTEEEAGIGGPPEDLEISPEGGGVEEAEEAEPLPTMSFDDEDEPGEAEPLPTLGGDEEAGGDQEDAALPTFGFGEEEEEAEPLPTQSSAEEEEEEGEEAELAGAEAEDALHSALEETTVDLGREEEAPAAEAPEEAPAADPESLRSEGERLLEGGDEEGLEVLERAHVAFADQGRVEEAVDVVRRMAEERRDDVELRQRMVEYAYRSNDDDVLVGAYLDLADVLRRTGDAKKAQAVYQQVLDTDPDNEEAQEAVAELSGEAEPALADSGSEVASSEEYVDLGSMILDEEDEEDSTRFKIAAGAPTGDAAADFAQMLDQFRSKVAESMGSDDVAAHYDLGTAYKEMGLVDEAISEFQAALRADRDHLPTYEMLGQCFLEQGMGQAAIQTLEKALNLQRDVEDDFLGIYYYLGRAHEELGRTDEAVDYYDKVFALDINFMDVTERLRDLR